jgi:NAD(P)-dependent dehydrogenase (short-subunit alcohol dehydrogenase family)
MTARKAWNSSYNTNVTSTHIFTTALMPLLFAAVPSPVETRILFVSSTVASHAWTQGNPDLPINRALPSGWPKASAPNFTSYRVSKTALTMMYWEWCRVLANDPIKCHLVCPGLVATNFGGETPEQARTHGAQDPALSGIFFRDVIEGKYNEYAGLGGKLISQYIPGKVVEW